MFCMTAEEYSSYKLRVLAKCSGANVHKINGLLGRIGRIISAMQRGIIQSPEDIRQQEELYNETLKDIGSLTCIFP